MITWTTRRRSALASLLLFGLFIAPVFAWAQAPSSGQGPSAASTPRPGGFVPGQKRAPEDPAAVAHGKTLFAINCRGCHGSDLRGGDMGGPSLLRSPVALSDQHGEQIVPIIHGARQNMGMPAIDLNDADAHAVAAYVRSVIGSIGGQGKPPSEGHTDPDILVGNAGKGKAYFDEKCSACHSATNDLKGIASRIPDQKKLQTAWVAGGRETEVQDPARTPAATVTLASGKAVNGVVAHLDEFLITLKLPDGTEQSISRVSDSDPQIVIHDPMAKHRELLTQYTDSDIHDVTAYLATLK